VAVTGQRRLEVDPYVAGSAVLPAQQHVEAPVVASVAVHGDRHLDVVEDGQAGECAGSTSFEGTWSASSG
jgi:hypothetical protein